MKIFQALAILLLIVVTPGPVSAHLAGQPPFFKINGTYSNLYPVPTVSSPELNLPQDLAADNFAVNQQLNFEIDSKFLPVPQDIVGQTKFTWDFGDGEQGSGLKNSHVYRQPKSYILTISAQAQADAQPTLIQSVMIQILPNKDYKLPTSVIKVNNQKSKDALTDILKANFSQPVLLDGSESKAGNSKIVSYLWDFGDTQSSNKLVIRHKYEESLGQIFPVLRVVDEQGFITDSFLEVENDPNLTTKITIEAKQTLSGSDPFHRQQLLVYSTAVVVSLLAAAGAVKWLRRKKT